MGFLSQRIKAQTLHFNNYMNTVFISKTVLGIVCPCADQLFIFSYSCGAIRFLFIEERYGK